MGWEASKKQIEASLYGASKLDVLHFKGKLELLCIPLMEGSMPQTKFETVLKQWIVFVIRDMNFQVFVVPLLFECCTYCLR